MGGKLILNDTLQVTREQGFPVELVYDQHLKQPFLASQFAGREFKFTKPELRFYQPQPIKVSFVENIDGKWLYWGMVHILRAELDYVKNTTSGTYKIVDIFSPEKMKLYFEMRDGGDKTSFFA